MNNLQARTTPITKRRIPQRKAIPRLGRQEDSISQLVAISHELKLSQVPIFEGLLKRIMDIGDQIAAKKLIERLKPFYNRQLIKPDHFITHAKNLDGEFLLGYTEDGRRVGIDRSDMVRHVAYFGQSGSGKTTTARNIFRQCFEKGIHSLYFDPKGDTVSEVRNGADVIYWKQDWDNFLCPPCPNDDIDEFRNGFVKMFSDRHEFMIRGQSIVQISVDTLYKEFDVYSRWENWDWERNTFPTFFDYYDLLKTDSFHKRIRGRGRESLYSLIEKIEGILIGFPSILSCRRGFDYERLYREGRAIIYVTEGLLQEYQAFITEMKLFRYSRLFKSIGPFPPEAINLAFFTDEAKYLFGNEHENFSLKNLISTVRSLGISCHIPDQITSQISQSIFSNLGTVLGFRHSDGIDLKRITAAIGASIPQALQNYSLNRGEAIVRTEKCSDLLKIRVPRPTDDHPITKEEVQRIMAPKLAELNKDVISYSKEDSKPVRKPTLADSLDDNEMAMLRLLGKDFNRPTSHICKESHLSESAAHRTMKKLIRRGLVDEITTNLGEGGRQAKLLIPNRFVFEELGIPLPTDGRGKPLHKSIQQERKPVGRKLDFQVLIEPCLNGSSEGPDVGYFKAEKKIAEEICITSKPATECQNIEKNLQLGFDLVILSFINLKALEKTQELAKSTYPKRDLEKVRFCLVNQLPILLGEL